MTSSLPSRDAFARVALAQIPTLLTLLDRNPHSPTYGCFDRNYWHYRIIDFPSGMSQEFVWPLALAWDTDLPDNPFHRSPAVREWVEAGILFAARSAHADGSCDDYYPYERANGATVFALLAALESVALMGIESDEIRDFLHHRTDWLAAHDESGQLSNHQALIAYCLYRAGDLLGTGRWREAADRRLERLLSWQHAEGWFAEYEGCDPGYQSLTVGMLGMIDRIRPELGLRDALRRAVDVAAQFVHPDGSYGGEYGSRNTYNFFPHGFEIVGAWYAPARAVNDGVLRGLEAGLGPCYWDDHIIGHHAWSYLLAWREFVVRTEVVPTRQPGRVRFAEAGILIDRRDGVELYVGLNKGGVYKCFRDAALRRADTGVSLRVADGRKTRTAVPHLVDRYEVEVGEDRIAVSGRMGWAKQAGMTTFRLVVLRGIMLTFGRFFPNVVRRLLQAMLITHKQPAPFRFRREFRWRDGGWDVCDEIDADDWAPVRSARISGDQTSIYIAMSRTFHAGQLRPADDLDAALAALRPGQSLRVERRL